MLRSRNVTPLPKIFFKKILHSFMSVTKCNQLSSLETVKKIARVDANSLNLLQIDYTHEKIFAYVWFFSEFVIPK